MRLLGFRLGAAPKYYHRFAVFGLCGEPSLGLFRDEGWDFVIGYGLLVLATPQTRHSVGDLLPSAWSVLDFVVTFCYL